MSISKLFRCYIILVLAGIVFFSGYNFAQARVIINEIMYDLDGSDTGREWIEVYNDADTSVDLSSWKFFEANTNHGLVLSQGDANISAKGYAIISSDPTKFNIDWPGNTLTIFDSSFSLDNDGEALALKDPDLNIIDQYTYSSSSGATGNGYSLQLLNGSWTALPPTPGTENKPLPPSGSGSASNDTSATNTNSSETILPTANTKAETPKIKTKISAKTLVFVGLPVEFQANTTGYSGESLYSGKYFWNFGDGDSKEAKESGKFAHTYSYTGDYVVALEYYQNYYSEVSDASDKLTIKVVAADISISSVGDEKDFFVEIANDSDYDADIARWMLASSGKSFTLPKNTILGPKKKMIISSKITGFSIEDKSTLKLMSSTGETVFDYSAPVSPLMPPPPLLVENTVPVKISMAEDINKDLAQTEDAVNIIAEVPALNLAASALSAMPLDTDAGESSNNYLFSLGLAGFLALSGGAVYFLRRNKAPTEAGSDFKILDE